MRIKIIMHLEDVDVDTDVELIEKRVNFIFKQSKFKGRIEKELNNGYKIESYDITID
jgi:hypothetical protein